MHVRPRVVLFTGGLAAGLALAVMQNARALPPPEPPLNVHPSSSPTAPPSGTELPYGSPLLFVLDDKISSASTTPGTVIHMHLRNPLVVNGVLVAAAGTPATFAVITTLKAHSGDEDGAIQIHLDPMPLPGRDMALPIRAIHEYLTVEHTAGQLSTLAASDTVFDIFIPYHVLYHALRPGRQMVLPPGTVLRAITDATINAATPPRIALETPPPFISNYDTPHADLTVAPLYTPAPMRPRPLPKGHATLPPSPAPTPSPNPSTSTLPAANAVGSAQPSGAASAQPSTTPTS